MLEKLLNIEQIDKIIVNTDAVELLEKDDLISSRKVTLRPRKNHLCGNDVSMNLIINDDILFDKADCYLMTHTTNPLLGSDTIVRALDLFINEMMASKADSLFTVNKIQSRFYDQSSKPINHNPEKLIPTQDLSPIYEENSNLYIFTEESFRESNSRIGKRPLMFATSKLESVDIDYEEDWDLATMIYKTKCKINSDAF